MTEEQDVLSPRRQRRRLPAILLGTLPAAIAATILVAGTQYAPPAEATTTASDANKSVVAPAANLPGITAPAAKLDVAATVPTIVVTIPKPKVVAPVVKKAPTKVSKSTKSTVTKKSTKSTPKKKTSSKSYKKFCANPSNPVSASGATGKALLAAVNKQRAKLGISKLSWSSSMASTATSWSKSMLKKDLKTDKLIDGLAHNPNRPGAENVAVVYNSGGYSGTTAVSKMHKNLVYSNGHCLNLMNPKYSSMGAGVASSEDGTTWYATENFR